VRLHGLYLNKVQNGKTVYLFAVLETPDNQLDFNLLTVTLPKDPDSGDDEPGCDEFKYQFKQHRMLEPRCRGYWKSDPIVKFSTAFSKDGYNHSVALRESGNVDFYYNCCRCHSEEEGAEIKF